MSAINLSTYALLPMDIKYDIFLVWNTASVVAEHPDVTSYFNLILTKSGPYPLVCPSGNSMYWQKVPYSVDNSGLQFILKCVLISWFRWLVCGVSLNKKAPSSPKTKTTIKLSLFNCINLLWHNKFVMTFPIAVVG